MFSESSRVFKIVSYHTLYNFDSMTLGTFYIEFSLKLVHYKFKRIPLKPTVTTVKHSTITLLLLTMFENFVSHGPSDSTNQPKY